MSTASLSEGTIGLDVGTGGTRGLLVDAKGIVRGSAGHSYPVSFPEPLWAEQNPDDWQRAANEVLGALAARANEQRVEVKAIGLTGQMHGATVLDDRDKPLCPAIIWMDQRSLPEANDLDQLVGSDELRSEVCNPGLPNMTATKVLWLRRHRPRIHERVAHLLLPKDYVRLGLTGEHASDVSDASGTLLLNVRQRKWEPTVIDAVGLRLGALPSLYESPEISGVLRVSAAVATGLRAGIPVAAGAGDQAAGAIAAGVIAPGPAMISLGTSGVVFGAMDHPMRSHPSLHSFCHARAQTWHWMGVTQSAGGSLKWLRDQLFPGASYEELDRDAAAVPPGADNLLFLPYLMGERAPIMDPYATAAFVGLTLRHGRPHLVRAVLEGVAMSLRSVVAEAVDTDVTEARVTGGGARSNTWMVILAAILGLPVSRVTSPEGAAFGAAMLAAEALGYQTGHWAQCEVVVDGAAALNANRAYKENYAAYSDLYPALKPLRRPAATADQPTRASGRAQGHGDS